MGQLGDGTIISKSSPVQIGTDTWKEIYPGSLHCIGVKSDNTIWGWGNNISGQLGLGDLIIRSSPVQIGNTSTYPIIRALENRTLLGDATHLYGCGNSDNGMLGLSFGPSFELLQLNNDNYVSVSSLAGYDAVFAIKADGTLWSWGYNNFGQLGQNDRISRSSPVQIGTDTNWVEVNGFSARKSDNTLWVWGYNNYGQLGQNDRISRSSPVQIGTDVDWAFSCAKRDTLYAIKTDGRLFVCGSNATGALGLGISTTINRSSPVQLGTDTTWSKVDCSSANHAAALKTNNTLWVWGYNNYGQHGNGGTSSTSAPNQLGSAEWLDVGVGSSFIVAIKTDGTLWSCGYNDYGNLGQNDRINRSSPVQIGTDTNWSSVYCTLNNFFAVKTDGTLWGCGQNNLGQLGNNNNQSVSSPVQIGSLNNIKALSGRNHIILLDSSNKIQLCGDNTNGQLANNTNNNALKNYTSPTQIPGCNSVLDIIGTVIKTSN
jgi:alpha-tubulin suppressor-like RCC1 family protein